MRLIPKCRQCKKVVLSRLINGLCPDCYASNNDCSDKNTLNFLEFILNDLEDFTFKVLAFCNHHIKESDTHIKQKIIDLAHYLR